MPSISEELAELRSRNVAKKEAIKLKDAAPPLTPEQEEAALLSEARESKERKKEAEARLREGRTGDAAASLKTDFYLKQGAKKKEEASKKKEALRTALLRERREGVVAADFETDFDARQGAKKKEEDASKKRDTEYDLYEGGKGIGDDFETGFKIKQGAKKKQSASDETEAESGLHERQKGIATSVKTDFYLKQGAQKKEDMLKKKEAETFLQEGRKRYTTDLETEFRVKQVAKKKEGILKQKEAERNLHGSNQDGEAVTPPEESNEDDAEKLAAIIEDAQKDDIAKVDDDENSEIPLPNNGASDAASHLDQHRKSKISEQKPIITAVPCPVSPCDQRRSASHRPRHRYRCIHCLNPTPTLYKLYTNASVRLTRCPRCLRDADPYVERESLLVAMDCVLLRAGAYRHLLFNRDTFFASGRESDSGVTGSGVKGGPIVGGGATEAKKNALQFTLAASVLSAYLKYVALRHEIYVHGAKGIAPGCSALPSGADKGIAQNLALSAVLEHVLLVSGTILAAFAVAQHRRRWGIEGDLASKLFLAVTIPCSFHFVTVFALVWENTPTVRTLGSLFVLAFQTMSVSVVMERERGMGTTEGSDDEMQSDLTGARSGETMSMPVSLPRQLRHGTPLALGVILRAVVTPILIPFAVPMQLPTLSYQCSGLELPVPHWVGGGTLCLT